MTVFNRQPIPEIVEIIPRRFGDMRGFFSEVFSSATLKDAGLPVNWCQDNQSLSAERGTVRGLHWQIPPFAQDKLIRVLRGAIYDVAVDIRFGSPTYGKWVGINLSAENFNQFFIPRGFAHGFMTLVEDTEVLYKVSSPYSPEAERAMRWDDPNIGIDWPLAVAPVLSDKDRIAPPFSAVEPHFVYAKQP